MTDTEIRAALEEALASVNRTLPADRQVPMGDDVVLLGDEGGLDSLAFVGLVVALEDRLGASHGSRVGLMDLLVDSGSADGLTIGRLLAGIREATGSDG